MLRKAALLSFVLIFFEINTVWGRIEKFGIPAADNAVYLKNMQDVVKEAILPNQESLAEITHSLFGGNIEFEDKDALTFQDVSEGANSVFGGYFSEFSRPSGDMEFVSFESGLLKDMPGFVQIDRKDGYDEILTLTEDYAIGANSLLAVNIDSPEQSSKVVNVEGDLSGTSRLLLRVSDDIVSANKILFLEAPNDMPATDASFDVWRVKGSIYDWRTVRDGANWYVYADNSTLTPEVASYVSLQSMAISQNNGLLWNLKNKVINVSRDYVWRCREKDNGYSDCPIKRPLNLWFVPAYSNIKVNVPFSYESKVSGGDAGFDGAVGYGRLGVFASYRTGEYEMEGNGRKYLLSGSSDVDIESYLGGLYYNFNAKNLWLLSSVYSGVLKSSIETNDDVEADTDGIQFGAGMELGYIAELGGHWNIEPNVGIHYTQIKLDDTIDNNGMVAEYNILRQTKTSVGIKLEKYFPEQENISSIYFEPSVIHLSNHGNKVRLMNKFDLSTVEDDTYVRLELGGSLNLGIGLKAFGTVSNTFSHDFRDTSVQVGLNYAF